ncbi:cysteine-rich receptor-like protein kinase 10 isoform X1 [Phragmites australis]|uniref:cysteine-rich receptor-like protein kinase 10 isoform X1 n=1 Tax=Phragmites australis TaxID=29695 RepID=UPI002D791668|nr:cysteine-rich receptor-like protein kinase 10 isoform X1 [Phragmites australis]
MIAVVLLVLGFTLFVAADPLDQICGTSDNYTANSTYQANLVLLSAALPNNASSTQLLFAKGSDGASPDTVYGLALCRGDTNASGCSSCLATAFQDVQKLCAFSKDAIIFYDTCLLGFSNHDFRNNSSDVLGNALIVYSIQNITEPMLPGCDPSNPDSVTVVTSIIIMLLQETAKLAAYNSTRMYATGYMVVSSTFPPLYSLAQCTPDLAPGDCWACLRNISEMATKYFTGKQGALILTLRCNFRYEVYPFYHGEPMRHIGSLGVVVPPAPAIVPPAPAIVPPALVPNKKHNSRTGKVLVIALVVPLSGSFICSIILLGFRKHRKGKGSQDKAKMNVQEAGALVWELEGRSSEFTFYDFSQVLESTNNFSEENKLGQGGFGPVYKGRFPDGLEIAVKRLASHSGQGFTEFKNEIQLIAKLQHTNLVRLLGCCSQGEEKTLIYEYLPNKSLDFFIFDETRKALLDWNKRLVIIEGIAQGLLYLHKHSRLRVIHRDLKASNILLDCEMKPKISDFGLAKIFSTNDTEGNTKRIVGTYGYMAPEYAAEGLFSIKSDVFSFGVLFLEIVSGKRTSSFHGYGDFINLLGYAWQFWKDGLWLQLVDACLVAEGHTLEMMRCINIALLCVQENAADRPTMSEVVAMLSSESMTLPEPKHPAYFHVRVTTEVASTIVVPSSVNDLTVSALGGR